MLSYNRFCSGKWKNHTRLYYIQFIYVQYTCTLYNVYTYTCTLYISLKKQWKKNLILCRKLKREPGHLWCFNIMLCGALYYTIQFCILDLHIIIIYVIYTKGYNLTTPSHSVYNPQIYMLFCYLLMYVG